MKDVRYHVLHPANFRLDGGAMFGIIPKPLWEKVAPPDELNRIDLSLRVMLIETKNRRIILDSGIGDYHDPKFNARFDVRGKPHPLTELLKNNFNLNPHDITDLVIGHLHFDHAGGMGTKQKDITVPLFPKATLHLHQKHYDYALNPTERDGGSFLKNDFLPVIEYYQQQKMIHFVSEEQGLVLKDNDYQLNFMVSHGHTPYLLHPYDKHFIYMADLVPTSHHIPIPWVMAYDMNPGVSTKDKQRFFEFIHKEQLTLIFEHDPQFWGGKLKREAKGNFVASVRYDYQQQTAVDITARLQSPDGNSQHL